MPHWREKLKASMHGEVSRESIDPYRAAGSAVYDYVMNLDTDRVQASLEPHLQVALLAGWVAFALQVLGDEMLDADAALDPSTADYVPPVTAEQVMEFYEPVQAWMARAQAAKASPSYRLDTEVPEVLPEWVEVEPCPQAHLVALRQAVNRLRSQTESLMAGFEPGPSQAHAKDISGARGSRSWFGYRLCQPALGRYIGPPPEKLHENIEASLKHAVETYFYLGQVIAMPSLADAPRRVRDNPDPDQGRPKTFLETVIQSYPQVGQGRRGALSGIGGGILGGMLGEAIASEIFGGGGGWGGGGWGGGGFGGPF